MADALADVAGDHDMKVVIHTGTGDTYNALWGKPVTDDQTPLYIAYDDAEGVVTMDEKAWFGRMIIENLLTDRRAHDRRGERPVHHALRGARCSWTSCWPPGTLLRTSALPRGMVPGDGQHVVWEQLVGPEPRPGPAAHGAQAERAGGPGVGRRLGSAAPDKLVDRAWGVAATWRCGHRSCCGTRVTSSAQNLKHAFLNEMDHGLQAELWAQRQFFPFGAGMQPLDRPWDQKPWSH